MIVTLTEVRNDLEKYLTLAAQEEIIITKNGTEIAKLSAVASGVGEKAEEYSYGGRKASYEEFLELTKDTEKRYEYIDGEIYLLASPKTAHQIALTELIGIFHNWFDGKTCTPMVAPYDISLKRNAENINVVQPDLMVICDLKEKLDANDYYQGVPTLVVEILSEGTRRKDLIKKLDLYMSCDVREYWIVNPLNQEVVVYQFENQNIKNSVTFRKPELAQSYIFPGLTAGLDKVFRS